MFQFNALIIQMPNVHDKMLDIIITDKYTDKHKYREQGKQ